MTGPHSAFSGGALDLSQVKAQAEAREAAKSQAQSQGTSGGIAPFFEVTDVNFENDVVRRSTQVPVIALIGTQRSPASEQLKADFQELANAGNLKFLVGYIDADTFPQIAQVFSVQQLPTVVAIGAGQPLTNFEGGQPKEALQQWVDALVEQIGPKLKGLDAHDLPQEEEPQPAEDPRLTDAEAMLNRGDFDGALGVYDSILADEPNNADIKQARNTTVLLKRLNPAQRETDPIAAADAAPEDIDAQFDAADAEIVAGSPESAFDRLITLMATKSGEEKNQVRDRLLELFALFDAADPRVLAARTKLASSLY
ncbi:MAG TPA: tetratricopeptide repeat protein [Corynebacterium sp.]|nr:tetratricopeptide repeat protein [Corynebacterium sp.]